jgi:hypothetical protein
MGGNAIENARRIPRDEYFVICEELQAHFPELKMKAVKAFRQKKDFGDIDIVVEIQPGLDIPKLVKERLQPSKVFHNNMFFSFEYKGVQVDFISMSKDEFVSTWAYFAWNDLGNFIGRTARSLNFKYGHEGLVYELRLGDHYKNSIVISRDTKQILEFLGYNYDSWLVGFETEEEIFGYAASSPYFNPSYFTLEEQSHNDRVRNKKRKMYQKMLTYITENGLEDKPRLSKEERAEHYERAKEFFGDEFHKIVLAETKEYERQQEFKKYFNGEIVSEITGLTGKDLGKFMQSIFVLSKKNDFVEMVLDEAEEDREGYVHDRIVNWMAAFFNEADDEVSKTILLEFNEHTRLGTIYGGSQVHRFEDKLYMVYVDYLPTTPDYVIRYKYAYLLTF